MKKLISGLVCFLLAGSLLAQGGNEAANKNDAATAPAAVAGKYPWGDQWPPPERAGNYAPVFKLEDFDYTSSVGSFAANEFGLYDMGGNVTQWCEDWYQTGMNGQELLGEYSWLQDDGGGDKYRVIRGASWHAEAAGFMLSSRRDRVAPSDHNDRGGFRCVLAPVPVSP